MALFSLTKTPLLIWRKRKRRRTCLTRGWTPRILQNKCRLDLRRAERSLSLTHEYEWRKRGPVPLGHGSYHELWPNASNGLGRAPSCDIRWRISRRVWRSTSVWISFASRRERERTQVSAAIPGEGQSKQLTFVAWTWERRRRAFRSAWILRFFSKTSGTFGTTFLTDAVVVITVVDEVVFLTLQKTNTDERSGERERDGHTYQSCLEINWSALDLKGEKSYCQKSTSRVNKLDANCFECGETSGLVHVLLTRIENQ